VVTLEGALFDLPLVTFLCSDDWVDIIEVMSCCFARRRSASELSWQEIISEEIVDETDRYEDNTSKKRAKRMTTSAIMRG
jgi:hypothetical protein